MLLVETMNKALSTFVNYAHRGASFYAPENTSMAFYEGIRLGANGIETDIQMSKDGELVLFHDDTLQRVCGVDGKVQDYTRAELSKQLVHFPDASNSELADRISFLDEFLEHFGFRNLYFALEIKENNADIDEKFLDLVDSHDIWDKVVVTSFHQEVLERLRSKREDITLGYLVRSYDENVESFINDNSIDQICLNISNLDAHTVNLLQDKGMSVRAWGVKDTTLMQKALDLGVNAGMTIDFPDLLVEAMEK